MYSFLVNNRDELIARCGEKVALRPHHTASAEQLALGVPLFLDQLIRTLSAERDGEYDESLRISGASGGDVRALSEMGVAALAHGKHLLELGFTVDQVVHAYGDLCQAITDLAVERDAPFAIDEFRTLNRCLDNAIADAVSGFGGQRDEAIAQQTSVDANERLGSLVDELRNHLHTATIGFAALEAGKLPVAGATAALVKRSLASLATILTETISEVRRSAAGSSDEPFSVASLVADAAVTGSISAEASGCTLTVAEVDPALFVSGNRRLLGAALFSLLQNAFKFTLPGTEITLTAHRLDQRILIDVQDQCGGLSSEAIENLFKPFKQMSADRTGLGLGLSIARRGVEALGGSLTVTDLPGIGCIFTINLPVLVKNHVDSSPLLGEAPRRRARARQPKQVQRPEDESMDGSIAFETMVIELRAGAESDTEFAKRVALVCARLADGSLAGSEEAPSSAIEKLFRLH